VVISGPTKFSEGRPLIVVIGLLIALPILFLLSLTFGSVSISINEVFNVLIGNEAASLIHEKILLNLRLPRAITAVLAGAALSVTGLQMQTIFKNPLADPFVLGVNSGASLGVAIVILALNPAGMLLLSELNLAGNYAIVFASTIGAGCVLTLVMLLSLRIDLITLLIIGLMIGYVTSALVSVLMFFSLPERLQSFFSWTFGSFGNVTWSQMQAMAPAIIMGLIMILFSMRVMNALLLGDSYAKSMGVNTQFWQFWILISASLLAGTVTGFCGPIGFLGVAVPHLCRALTQTSDHRWLLPTVILMGSLIALFADFIAQIPGSHAILPLNSVTALIGAPVIITVLYKQRSMKQTFAG
jgi:iron complex transport system permease protein|tara:strand:+ start:1901 stop:2968 length:1068 start_codon:yes stop_codon:yes gene_type:complete